MWLSCESFLQHSGNQRQEGLVTRYIRGFLHNRSAQPRAVANIPTDPLSQLRLLATTWRFMGSYKWGYMSPKKAYKYSYPTYNPNYNYPWTSKKACTESHAKLWLSLRSTADGKDTVNRRFAWSSRTRGSSALITCIIRTNPEAPHVVPLWNHAGP